MRNNEPLNIDSSFITECHVGDGCIIVVFAGGYGYIYNSIKPGLDKVNKMVELAELESKEILRNYIITQVKDSHYRKLF